MLREAEVKLAGGKKTGEVCRELGISEQSYYYDDIGDLSSADIELRKCA